ncbi:polysaccharide deacetylase family protein [Lysinibacillus sp. KU-BSD001]|uniref:polysaccharide deacetylase family protein n=1 Tax=Lysinibacillus sp. KU-BSD001 TaxID=3141328 RepID=UPI0036ED452D
MKKTIGLAVSITIILFSIVSFAFADELHWGFKKASGGAQIEIGSELENMLTKYDAIYRGDPESKTIYLTFDNGYENGFTERILDALKEEDVPATFFLTGHYVTSASDLVKRMVKDGHIIGNHSDKHPNMARLSEEQMVTEWKNFDKKLKEVAGVERTYYTRPPEGVYNEAVLAAGLKHEYRHIFWSIAFKDWEKDVRRGGDYAYNELMKQLHPGAIILMHTVAEDNADAIPKFIKDAKAQGYTFGSLDDLYKK